MGRGSGLAKGVWGAGRVERVELRSGRLGERSDGVRWGEEAGSSGKITLLDFGFDAVRERDASAS
jgi:hypothetical protein